MRSTELTQEMYHGEVVSAHETHKKIDKLKEKRGKSNKQAIPITDAKKEGKKLQERLTPKQKEDIKTFQDMYKLTAGQKAERINPETDAEKKTEKKKSNIIDETTERAEKAIDGLNFLFKKKREYNLKFDKKTESTLSKVEEGTGKADKTVKKVKDAKSKADRLNKLLTGTLDEKAEAADGMLDDYAEKHKDNPKVKKLISKGKGTVKKINKFKGKVQKAKELITFADDWNENSKKLPGGAGWTANGLNLFSKGAKYTAEGFKKTKVLKPVGDMLEYYGSAPAKPVQIISDLHQERMTKLKADKINLDTFPYASETGIFLDKHTKKVPGSKSDVEFTYVEDGKEKKVTYRLNAVDFVQGPNGFIVPVDAQNQINVQGEVMYKVKQRSLYGFLTGDCNKMEVYSTTVPPKKLGEKCI